MTDTNDEDEQAVVIDTVEDAIVAHTKAQHTRTTLDGDHPCRSWVLGQGIDPGGHPRSRF